MIHIHIRIPTFQSGKIKKARGHEKNVKGPRHPDITPNGEI
jgi:hypothetical protein